MFLGAYLRMVRDERQLSLRDVERLARQHQLGAVVSSGHLSVLERDGIKEPSPKVLYTLAVIYEIDYIDLMRRADYIPADALLPGGRELNFTLRGVSRLDPDQRRRVQRIIDFELHDSGAAGRHNRTDQKKEAHCT